MSTNQEKMAAIRHALGILKNRKEILVTIKEVSKLRKYQEYELLMIEDGIKRGEKILNESKTNSGR